MLRIEPTRWRAGRKRICRAALLAVLVSGGCAGPSSVGSTLRRWWQPGGGELQTSSSRKSASGSHASDRGANVPAPGAGVETSAGVSPQRAAAEALEASRQAQTAATAAVQASKAAIEASKMAVKAAAQTSDQNPPAPATEIAPESPKPPPTGPTSETPLELSATGETAAGKNREATADRLGRLDRSFRGIERTKLGPDDASRRELARQLLQSARKAFEQSDYAEANGLARKASVMLAPLVGGLPEWNTQP
jgi:hypothetical protein